MNTYVYIIGGFSPKVAKPRIVKIGYSANVEKRLESLQTGQMLELRVVAKWPASRARAIHVERKAHDRFSYLQVRGEWFRPRLAEMLDYINTMLGSPCPQCPVEQDEQFKFDREYLEFVRLFK